MSTSRARRNLRRVLRGGQITRRPTLWVAAAAVLAVLLGAPGSAQALEQKLTASDGAAGAYFGVSVDVDGDTAVVGAPRADALRGAVYVYTRSGDSWKQTAKLTASEGADGDNLGSSVAIEGDTIVAGAPDDDSPADVGQGSVYTFARTGAATRTETAKLTASDGAAGDELGSSVAIEGDTIVAGAPPCNVRRPAEGSVLGAADPTTRRPPSSATSAR